MKMFGADSRFYRIVREERLFCAVLAHLLMENGRNLTSFIDLVNSKLGDDSPIPSDRANEAEIYIEFTFLRDHWKSLGNDNDRRRGLIFELLSKVKSLSGYQDSDFPAAVSEFNAHFMGKRGARVVRDIAYPGQWSVVTLAERFGAEPDEFRDFCRFKWAFNIKPDIVVSLPDSRPLCIEAKLESGEGQYPSSLREAEAFDAVFGAGKGKVRQVELQKFMFDRLLDSPCQPLTIGLAPERHVDAPFVSWAEVFAALDLGRSLAFVEHLAEQNIFVQGTA